MRKTNFFSITFTLLFTFVLFTVMAFAQSTDPDNPTVVRQSVVQGTGSSRETVFYYYTFIAGPGVLRVTMDLKSARFTGNTKLSWELMDAGFKELASQRFSGIDVSERKVNEITLTRSQKVILKVKVTEEAQSFRFQFTGAVNFSGGSRDDNDDMPATTGDYTRRPKQICIPRNGTVVLTMRNGRTMTLDLSKVEDVEIQ